MNILSLRSRPVLDLHLNGESNLNIILTDLTTRLGVDIKIISAQLDYVGDVNFGKILLQLGENEMENKEVIKYFNDQNIKNVVNEVRSSDRDET
ncbi:NIL domain-containing protein [Parapedobacter defluvii]|uniref:NIL domain-containing protein n=1 Tax=Parapedobacter defluvii TaxID=2045106 RepID=UPI00333E66E6